MDLTPLGWLSTLILAAVFCGVIYLTLRKQPARRSRQDLHVPADYGTLQEAVDRAASGNIICIAPGCYTGRTTIRGKAVTIQHDGSPGDVLLQYDENTVRSITTISFPSLVLLAAMPKSTPSIELNATSGARRRGAPGARNGPRRALPHVDRRVLRRVGAPGGAARARRVRRDVRREHGRRGRDARVARDAALPRARLRWPRRRAAGSAIERG